MIFFASSHLEKKRRNQRWISLGLALITFSIVIPLGFILSILVMKGGSALSWEFISTEPLKGMTSGGIFPAIVGTLWLVGLSLGFSCPVGVIAAIYLTEYAPNNWFTRIINLAIINLAGVPSIVHALFGLGAFVLFMEFGTSILSASLTLAIMNLPVIITSTRESLEAVPRSFREACWNLGASRWQTIWHIVLPNSVPGILTGVIFSVSRAAGETAPILFTGAAFYLPYLPESVWDQCMALSMHLFTISTQVVGVPENLSYGTALVLVGIVSLVNVVSIWFRIYFRRHRKW